MLQIIGWYFFRLHLIYKYGIFWRKPKYVLKLIRNVVKAKIFKLLGLKKFILRGIDFATTYACNFNCEHCFTERLTPKGEVQTMSVEDYKRVVKEAEALGAIVFSFQGGEVTLGKYFQQLLEIIKVSNPQSNHIVVTTNGSLLDEEKIKEMQKAGVDTICLSIDSGIAEEHDMFRKYPGSFEKLMNSIPLIQKYKLKVSINAVISHESIYSEGLKKLLDFSHKNRFMIATILARPVGKWTGRIDYMLSREDLVYWNRLRRDYPFLVRDFDNNYGKRGCYAAKEGLYITPYGDVCPCPLTHISLGNVMNEPLQVIRERALKIRFWNHYHSECLTSFEEDFKKTYFTLLAEKEKMPTLDEFLNLQELNETEKLYKLWDKYWQQKYSITPTGKLILRSKQKILRRLVPSLDCKTAIDVGCGQGYCLEVFQKLGLETKGIDISPTAVQICQRKGLRNVSLEKLEEAEGKYDLVFSDGLIEHFRDFVPYAKHLMRLSNRYVLIVQSNHDSFLAKILLFLSERFGSGRLIPELDYKIPEFVSVFERNGFQLAEEKLIFFDTFKFLLFQKKK